MSLLSGFAGIGPGSALREASAGVMLLALAVPLNIGYAQIAGLPATAGMYALIVPTIVFALLTRRTGHRSRSDARSA
ncbi:SulP family inorganic anion transporter [Cellulomonas sp. P22]|uniref:SulP family inorganic anion transporter n=1 Tax=Cellulomonas sp. P22 TaxID=3373189 RepID=UPI0037A6CDE5